MLTNWQQHYVNCLWSRQFEINIYNGQHTNILVLPMMYQTIFLKFVQNKTGFQISENSILIHPLLLLSHTINNSGKVCYNIRAARLQVFCKSISRHQIVATSRLFTTMEGWNLLEIRLGFMSFNWAENMLTG